MDKKHIDLVIAKKKINDSIVGQKEILITFRAPANSSLNVGDLVYVQNNILPYEVVSVIHDVEVSADAVSAIEYIAYKIINFEYPETENTIDLVAVSFTYVDEESEKEETIKRIYRAPANSGITIGSVVEAVGTKYTVLSVDTILANSSLCTSIKKIQAELIPFEYENPETENQEMHQQVAVMEENLIIPNQANLGVNEDQQVMPDQDNLLPPEELEDEIDTSSQPKTQADVQKVAEESLK
jgi:hypothetical protein